jgi:hypothetical protein
MSYILEAIKKADQKRKLESMPDIHTFHEVPGTEPRRMGWLYGFAVILILNAGVIGWWLWSSKPDKGAVNQPPAKAVAVQTGPKTQAASPAPQSATTAPPMTPAVSGPPPLPVAQSAKPPTTGPGPQPIVAQAEAAKPATVFPPPPPSVPAAKAGVEAQAALQRGISLPSAQSAKPPAIEPAKRAIIAQAEAPKPATAPPPTSVPAGKADTAAAGKGVKGVPPKAAAAGQAAAPARVVPVFKQDTPEVSLPEEPIDSTEEQGAKVAAEEGGAPEAATPAAKGKAERSAKEVEDPELAKIPLLRQLPPDVQKTIPELHISFHSYSIKPANRMVSISGKILHEGQNFDENVKLETITQDGVIMVAHGRRFRLDMEE